MPTCQNCGQYYSPASGGHCQGGKFGGCCRNFTSDQSFDAHRKGPFTARYCLDVAETEGWRKNSKGYWTNRPPRVFP